MKIALICLPHYLHTKKLILEQLSHLDHTFVVFEELGKDNEFDKLICPGNVNFVELTSLDHDLMVQEVIRNGVEQVLSFSDRGLVPAACLREHFGFGGNSVETEQWVVDKGAMRLRLSEWGLSRIVYRTTTLAQLALDATAIEMPFIVKPTTLSGSLCVELIQSRVDLEHYVRRCKENKVFKDGNVILEEYIPGREFSVEGVVIRGEIKYLGVTESHTSGAPYFVGTGHDFFSHHRDREKIEEFIEQVIRCLNFNDCPFHIEVKGTPRGYEIIEVHSRYGGAMIMELVEASTKFKSFSGYIDLLYGSSPEITVLDDGLIYSQHLIAIGEGKIEKLALDVDLSRDPRVISYSIDYEVGGVVESNILPVNYLGYVTFTARSLHEANEFRQFIDRNLTVSLC